MLALLVAHSGPAVAQVSVSAKAVVISHAEGAVTAGGKAVSVSQTHPAHLSPDELIRSGAGGRAELMLNPCVALHLDENSAMRITASRLEDTRVELLFGSAIVRADGILRDTNVAVIVRNATVPLSRRGVYWFDADPPRLKVFDGKAVAQRRGGSVTVPAGRMAALDGRGAPEKFRADPRGEAFAQWSYRRAVTLLIESGYDGRAEREQERRELAWKRAEANGTLPPGSRPPSSEGATTGRLGFCSAASIR